MAQRPFTAVPATRSSKKALRIKQNVILGSLILGFLLGPIAMVVASRTSGRISEVTASLPAEVPTPTVAFAEIVARDFVAGRPTAMPVAKDVPQNLGFNATLEATNLKGAVLVFDRVNTGMIGDTPVTMTRFRVTTPDGTVYNLTITTLRDKGGRDLLAALPNLIPAVFAPTETVGKPAPSRNDTVVDPSSEVRQEINDWATAYAAGDSAQLKNLIGGGSEAATGEYLGLGGFEAQQVVIEWAVLASREDAAYVRVRLVLGGTGANEYSASTEFDLLVIQWATPDPRVVAWGPPGSGPTLEPYQNNTANL